MSSDHSSAAEEIDAIIAKAGGWRGDTLAALRRAVIGADAGIVEEIKWRKPSKPEGVATWVCEGNVCLADVLKSAVRLTFPQGARLDDVDGLFNSRLDGATVRAIDFSEQMSVDEQAVRRLVRLAVERNRKGAGVATT
ncbi:DUF1801 domain-containing protein [Microbacterium sp. ARD32]|uniref:DUF1801 domain-containing protein n=1 Tax=Microbacterium sp. ARD32 TaxID=2962577 RepID=UPI002881F466|nr:DUF1801 domain-containing protein [Microbacterium sp. ARD32]MDT0156646.1 DUF1801 domain-containing protein [Microbacterium sp. ARD32]